MIHRPSFAGAHRIANASHSDIANIIILIVVWVGMALLANPIGDFPLNDDWVYGQAVKSLLTEGYYHFPSTSSANVGPQVYWGAMFCLPFGFSYTALRISSLAAGLIGVTTLYFVVKRFCRAPSIALCGALLLAVNPLYFALSNSFMTDVPFVTLLIVSLFFMTRGLEQGTKRDIFLGIAFSLAAVLIRQIGVILLVAFAMAYPVRFGINLRNVLKGVTPAIVGVFTHVGYQYWLVHWGRIPVLSGHSDVQQLISFTGRGWYMRQSAFSIVIYCGLFLLPLLFLFTPLGARRLTFRHLSRGDMFLLSSALVLTVLLGWKGILPPSLPNMIHTWGIGPLTLRDTYRLELNFPAVPSVALIAWNVVGLLSLAAAGGMLTCFAFIGKTAITDLRNSKLRSRSWLVCLLATAAMAYFTVLTFMSGSLPMMDRYVLPFVPLLIILLAQVVPSQALQHRCLTLSASAIFAFGYFSVTATHDYLEWNRLRWTATSALMADGAANPRQVDGGYEFNGLMSYEANYRPQDGKSWWWVHDDSYMIGSGPIPGYAELNHYDFHRWFLWGTSSVVVLKKIGTTGATQTHGRFDSLEVWKGTADVAQRSR